MIGLSNGPGLTPQKTMRPSLHPRVATALRLATIDRLGSRRNIHRRTLGRVSEGHGHQAQLRTGLSKKAKGKQRNYVLSALQRQAYSWETKPHRHGRLSTIYYPKERNTRVCQKGETPGRHIRETLRGPLPPSLSPGELGHASSRSKWGLQPRAKEH